MKRIIVTFDKKTGSISIKAEGYGTKDGVCQGLEATRQLEEKLGIIEPEREMIPEENIVETQQQVGGES